MASVDGRSEARRCPGENADRSVVWGFAPWKQGNGVVGVTLSGEGVEDQRRPEKRVEGIEPSSLAWKAIALPLSYTRMRSCGPVMSRACPRVPLLDGPCSFGVLPVGGPGNRGPESVTDTPGSNGLFELLGRFCSVACLAICLAVCFVACLICYESVGCGDLVRCRFDVGASHKKWEVQDSNLRRQSHLIYSQAPLTARETSLMCW